MGVAGCLGGCLGPASSACITDIKTARRGGGRWLGWEVVSTKIFSLYIIPFPLLFLTPSLYYLPLFSHSALKRKRRKEIKKKREQKPKIGQKRLTADSKSIPHKIARPPHPFWCLGWGRKVGKSAGSGGGAVDGPSTSHPQNYATAATHRRAHTRRQRPAKLIKLAAPLQRPSPCAHTATTTKNRAYARKKKPSSKK